MTVQIQEIRDSIAATHRDITNAVIFPPLLDALTDIVIDNIIEELDWSLGGAKEGDAGADWINRRIEEWSSAKSARVVDNSDQTHNVIDEGVVDAVLRSIDNKEVKR